ncbi:MAG: hypothetical protein EPO62_02235 [Candidatus Nitrosotenuis sp.]|nr:MAG: hypothetical protein EPO62_02235 [Candidatus Nitrosotenuis sp.]
MKSYIILSLLVSSLLLPNLAFATPGTSQVTVNGSTFDVNYDVTGLDVTGIDADVDHSSLIVTVNLTDVSGTLVITFDRSFFDSKENGEDADFIVLLDGGTQAVTTESNNTVSRTLTIEIPSDTLSLDIIGSSFGSGPPAEQPQETTPPVETPVETTPPAETPAETTCGAGTVLKDGQCVVEQTTPPAETPEETTPPAEAPSDMTCGPGTILKDGACVLDQTCGPGTILKDDACVLDESPAPQAPAESRGLAFELIAPIVAAFVIAFVIMMILWAIGKAGRSKN